MDFSHRGSVQPPEGASHAGSAPVSVPSKSKKRDQRVGRLARIASVILLFSTTILVLAITFLLYFGNSNESQFIMKSKFQAVDLNFGGSNSSDQIYFGNITKLNDKYMVLQNIYYIVPNATSGSSSNNYTLVKLGCELHAPYDQMVINRDHVVFWENLQTSGTVAQKIAEYQKANPNGPNCSQSSSNSAASSSSNAANTQSSGSSSTSTTPTTTPANGSSSSTTNKKP